MAPGAGVPPRERFAWFCETVSSSLMPVALSTRHTADFRAGITDLDLGGPRLSAFAFSPVVSRRTPAHVRRGDPEQFQLALITRGVFRVSQRSRESEVSGGGLVLTDSSRPMENETTAADGGPVEAVVLQIPRPALPLRPDRLDRLLARGIRADRGSAAVFAGFVRTLLGQARHCRPEELRAMGSVALDLAATCLAQQLGDPGEAPAEARAREMRRRITCFIDNNLGDPDLTPGVVADRHGISLRGLHSLFRDQPMSVAARIRRGRLERAHAELACRESSALPVQVVAARWGFSSATAFSRAFRETYGMAPTEHRAAALARGAQEPCTPRTAASSPRA